MSPSWPRQTEVVLGPERIVIRRRPLLSSRWSTQITRLSPDLTPGVPAWRAAICVLEHLIEKLPRSSHPIKITLSHEFVRFCVVPWDDHILSSQDKCVQARHALKRLYGARPDAWTVSVETPRFGQPSLAAAIDIELLQALVALTRNRHFGIARLEPWATAAIRSIQREGHLQQTPLYLVLVEGSKMVLLGYSQKSLQTCIVRRMTDSSSEAMYSVLRQECRSSADSISRVLVCDVADRLVRGRYSVRMVSDPLIQLAA